MDEGWIFDPAFSKYEVTQQDMVHDADGDSRMAEILLVEVSVAGREVNHAR